MLETISLSTCITTFEFIQYQLELRVQQNVHVDVSSQRCEHVEA